MNTGGFPLDKVHEKLIAKGSRLVLSMGDCCNNIFNPFAGNEKGFFVVESDSALTKEQFYKSLFAESRGDIIFSGSEVGQCSYGTNLPSWESIMEDAKNRVSKLNFEQKQIPQFAINLKSTPVPDNPLIPVDPDEPQIKYNHINKYLNDLTDESLTTQSRDKLANDFGKYFIPKTRVDLYVNTTLTEVMTIEDYVKRIKLHGKKISYINLIENKSTKDGNSKKFNHITVQEIWNK